MLSDLLSERAVLEKLLVGMDDNDPNIETVGSLLNKNSLEIIHAGAKEKKSRRFFSK